MSPSEERYIEMRQAFYRQNNYFSGNTYARADIEAAMNSEITLAYISATRELTYTFMQAQFPTIPFTFEVQKTLGELTFLITMEVEGQIKQQCSLRFIEFLHALNERSGHS